MQLNVKETRTANHFYVLASVSRAAQARRIVFVRCVRARVRAKDVLVQVMHCTAECSKVIRLSPALAIAGEVSSSRRAPCQAI